MGALVASTTFGIRIDAFHDPKLAATRFLVPAEAARLQRIEQPGLVERRDRVRGHAALGRAIRRARAQDGGEGAGAGKQLVARDTNAFGGVHV